MTSDPSTRRAEQVGNSLPQSYFGELLQDREPSALVRSLFIPRVWLGTWNRERLQPQLLSGREQIWRACPFCALCSYQISDNGASSSLLSSSLCSQPLSKPPDSLPLGFCQNLHSGSCSIPIFWDSWRMFWVTDISILISWIIDLLRPDVFLISISRQTLSKIYNFLT